MSNQVNGNKTVVPLHNDIAEPTARAICKQLGIPPVKFNLISMLCCDVHNKLITPPPQMLRG